jgi:hypothetical protein
MAGSGVSSILTFCCLYHRKPDKGKGRQHEESIRLPERQNIDGLTLLTEEELRNPSLWDSPRYVGLCDPHPDTGLRKLPLDFTELQSMSDDQKRQNIVRRANYYLQVYTPPGIYSDGAFRAHRNAQTQGPFSGNREDPALALDVAQVFTPA